MVIQKEPLKNENTSHRPEEKYLQNACWIKDFYGEHIQISYN